jgi:IclR family acetate operon transcriptional repressor
MRIVNNRKSDIYYIEVLGKTLDILDVFGKSEQQHLSLHQISVQTRLNKNTVFRILYTLAEHGYITKEHQTYQLGAKFVDLGNVKLRRKDLVSVASPYLDSLRDEFGETVNLGVLDGESIRYVDVRESRERFRLAERIGGSDRLHSTALGKAHLAFLPPDKVRSLLKESGMPKQTEHTITTISALKANLQKVRSLGYALDRQESMLGAFCVAAPILDANQTPIAALSISGPATRFNETKLPMVGRALMAAAAAIQEKLGR